MVRVHDSETRAQHRKSRESQLDPPAKGTERRGRGVTHWEWHQFFEASNLSPSDTPSPTRSHFQILSNQFHQAGTKHSNIYTSEDLSRSNTTVLLYQTSIKKMHHGLAHRPIWWGCFFQVPSSQMPLVPGKLTWEHSGTGHSSKNHAHHSPSVLNDLHHFPPESILECPKVLFLYHPCSFASQLGVFQPVPGTLCNRKNDILKGSPIISLAGTKPQAKGDREPCRVNLQGTTAGTLNDTWHFKS